ncbi:DUF1566 domain-containing protein [Leptospira langatensis]|uniref:DUF1566 domain-containing protein n=2 Tax=Leptospira langatensis TaxID=2484983 RepID=A0A5F1ZRR6_9LEPT|nr:DUF1566 domain-containing protein [Leptospira langatensis]TGL38776.1 DUF1566 domain-containing protein [Leptospira langatensis]
MSVIGSVGKSLFAIAILFLLFSEVFADAPSRFVQASTSDANAIQDKSTGLYWQKCIYPMKWDTSGSTSQCKVPTPAPSGNYLNSSTMTWSQATNATKKICTWYGANWRVPTIAELKSLVERSQYNPALNSIFDPGAAAGGSSGNGIPDFFWTSTVYGADVSYAWTVNFYYGYIYHTSAKVNSYYLRCVANTP